MNNNNQENAVEQLLRKPEVKAMVANIPDSTLYYLMAEGSFPKPVKLGKRSVAWKRSEIEFWIQSRERAMDIGTEDKTNMEGA